MRLPNPRVLRQFLALWLFLPWAAQVRSEGPDHTGARLNEVQQRISATQGTREALQAIRDRLDGELAEIERRQGQLARSIHELETQSQVRQKRIAVLGKDRERLRASVKRQQDILVEELRGAYVIGRKDWLKLLLNQEEPSRVARVLAYYGYLNRARAALVHQWQEDMGTLRDTEARWRDESTRQAEARERMAGERAKLLESTRARRHLLNSWDEELKTQDARLTRLKEDEQRLQTLLRTLQDKPDTPPPAPAPPATAVRKMRCPPPGTILARFGDPRMSGHWDGMLIAGKTGSTVRAVADGQVAFADWFRGYGLLMIIDQGEGVMSLYAFNQALYKSKGDAVRAGDAIAAVGASGGRGQPGLYFGIREQGRPVDPPAWCARRQ